MKISVLQWECRRIRQKHQAPLNLPRALPPCLFPGGDAAAAVPGGRGIAAGRHVQPDLRRRRHDRFAVRSKSSFKLSRQTHNPGSLGDILPLSEDGNGNFFIHGGRQLLMKSTYFSTPQECNNNKTNDLLILVVHVYVGAQE